MWHGEKTTFFEQYDVASAGYTYGRFAAEQVAPKPLKTTGSSTTIEEVTSGDNPFHALVVGAKIAVQPGPDTTIVHRLVTAIASGASATIDTAADFSNGGAGRHFRFRNFYSGTGAEDGWVNRGSYEFYDIEIIVTTLNATNVMVSIEGRITGLGSAGRRLLAEKTYTAVGDSGTDMVSIANVCDQIRVGLKVTGDVGVQSVSIYGVGRNAA